MMHTAMFLTMGPTFHGSSSPSSHLHYSNPGHTAHEITPPTQRASIVAATTSTTTSSPPSPALRYQPRLRSPAPSAARADDDVFVAPSRGVVDDVPASPQNPVNNVGVVGIANDSDCKVFNVNNNNVEIDDGPSKFFLAGEYENDYVDEDSIRSLSSLNRYNLPLQNSHRHFFNSIDFPPSPPPPPPMSELSSSKPSAATPAGGGSNSIAVSAADVGPQRDSMMSSSSTTTCSSVFSPSAFPPHHLHAPDNCFFRCLEGGGGCGGRDGDDGDNNKSAVVFSQPQQRQTQQQCLVFDRLVDLWRVFDKYADDGLLHERRIRSTLLELDVFPAAAQIQEMLYVAGKRSPASMTQQQQQNSSFSSSSPARSYLTFGEFCFFATDLKEKYEKQPLPPTLCAKQRKNVESGRQLRKFSSLVSNFQVFLGGACNPTSWRQDIAIPILSQHSISFYNPQRPDWDPQMIEIEDQAKQVADVLFFVVDNKTRSTSSMVEAAYLTGCDCSVFLVVKSYEGPGVEVQGERMSQSEYDDLTKAQLYLTDIVERHGLPVFSDIATAIHCAVKLLRTKDMRVQDLTLEDGAEPVRFGHIKLGDRFVGAGQVFQSYDPQRTGCIATKDVCVAFKSITKEDLDDAALAKLKQPSSSHHHHHHHHHHHQGGSSKRRTAPSFNFDEFCCVLTNFKNNPSLVANGNNHLSPSDVVVDNRHGGGGAGNGCHNIVGTIGVSKSAPPSPPSSHGRHNVGVGNGQKGRWWKFRRFLLCKFSSWFLPSATAPAPSRLIGDNNNGSNSNNPSSSPSPSTTPNQRHQHHRHNPTSFGTCNIPQSASTTLSTSPSSVSLSPSFSPPSTLGSLPTSDLGSLVTSQPSPTNVAVDASSTITSMATQPSHQRGGGGGVGMTHSASQSLVTPGSFTSSSSSSGISSAHSPSFSSSLSSSTAFPSSPSTSPPTVTHSQQQQQHHHNLHHHRHHLPTSNHQSPPPPPPPSTPSSTPRAYSSSSSRRYDIFLGGSIRDSSWRENIAIPELKKKGISYYHPKKSLSADSSTSEENSTVSSSSPSAVEVSSSSSSTCSDAAVISGRYLPMEATYRENSSLLLYVIDSTSRGLASMLEAAFYIGQGCRMVLCIREIPQGAVILQDKLTSNAIRDYNRSRKYLSDIATREGVPVFDDISEAVVAAIEILEKQKNTNVNLSP